MTGGGAWAAVTHLLTDIQLWYGPGPKGVVRFRGEFTLADPSADTDGHGADSPRTPAAKAAEKAEKEGKGAEEVPPRPSGASFHGSRPRNSSEAGGGAASTADGAAGDAAPAPAPAETAEAAAPDDAAEKPLGAVEASPSGKQHATSGAEWFAPPAAAGAAAPATTDGRPKGGKHHNEKEKAAEKERDKDLSPCARIDDVHLPEGSWFANHKTTSKKHQTPPGSYSYSLSSTSHGYPRMIFPQGAPPRPLRAAGGHVPLPPE